MMPRRKPTNPNRLPEILNLAGIAALLGVDPATARAMVNQGLIPALVYGRRVVRASKTAVLKAMEKGNASEVKDNGTSDLYGGLEGQETKPGGSEIPDNHGNELRHAG